MRHQTQRLRRSQASCRVPRLFTWRLEGPGWMEAGPTAPGAAAPCVGKRWQDASTGSPQLSHMPSEGTGQCWTTCSISEVGFRCVRAKLCWLESPNQNAVRKMPPWDMFINSLILVRVSTNTFKEIEFIL